MTERQERFRELYRQGLELIDSGKPDAAMETLYRAAKEAPEGWLALANELIKDKKYLVAADRCREVLKLTKNAVIRAGALNGLGMIECCIGNENEAEKLFRQSVAEFPNAPDAHSNLALLSQWRHDYEDSIRKANRALELDPWHEQATFIRAMCKLLSGNYIDGFKEYECRWRSKTNGLAKIDTNKPEWDGTNGKHVFVYGEQGAGDSILLLRYARLIKERGLRQSWVAQKGIDELMRHVPDIDQVVEVGEELPNFDCHIPAFSLPRVFGTTVETVPPPPQINVDAEILDGFNVGICWRGSKAQNNDEIRSTNLNRWAPILQMDGINIHSLQVDGADEALLFPQIIRREKPKSWMDTAERIKAMNAVVTVDTSVVHCAGSLGVPVFVAMHCRPYFVYPPTFWQKTPWYSSVKLFRQDKPHNWQPVFESIAKEIKELQNDSGRSS